MPRALHLITGLRLLSAPLVGWLIAHDGRLFALAAVIAAMVSDLADGALVRRFGRPSTVGGYFDATADFAFVWTAFSAFAVIGVMPFWLPAVIAGAFLLFVVISRVGPSIYDPIGRYIGGILYLAAIAILLIQDPDLHVAVLWIVTTALAATLTARARYAIVAWKSAGRA